MHAIPNCRPGLDFIGCVLDVWDGLVPGMNFGVVGEFFSSCSVGLVLESWVVGLEFGGVCVEGSVGDEVQFGNVSWEPID